MLIEFAVQIYVAQVYYIVGRTKQIDELHQNMTPSLIQHQCLCIHPVAVIAIETARSLF